jgi:hypothetical protein
MKHIRLLSVLLLCLANPLWAKCPNNFVEVHGKVQCTFKPNYKVLVTLIYSKHQLEASGQETALDIHDGSFKGEVAFSTFVSYNPLTGTSTIRVHCIGTRAGTPDQRNVAIYRDCGRLG